VYEEKVDGWRMLAYKDGRRVRLISRNAVDHTHRFRELAAAIAKLKPDVVVLDGEVAVYDEKLVSRFHLLGEEEPKELCTPPIFMAFDVLQIGNRDLRSYTLEHRRVILEDVAAEVVDTVHLARRLHGDGTQAWATVEARGYEGMVAKDPSSVGRSSPAGRSGSPAPCRTRRSRCRAPGRRSVPCRSLRGVRGTGRSCPAGRKRCRGRRPWR
jgi:bifunctional non-homologous end joining protein LigD